MQDDVRPCGRGWQPEDAAMVWMRVRQKRWAAADRTMHALLRAPRIAAEGVPRNFVSDQRAEGPTKPAASPVASVRKILLLIRC